MTIELQTGKMVKVTRKDLNEAFNALKNNEAFRIENARRGYVIEAEQYEIDDYLEWSDNNDAIGIHELIIDGVSNIYEL